MVVHRLPSTLNLWNPGYPAYYFYAKTKVAKWSPSISKAQPCWPPARRLAPYDVISGIPFNVRALVVFIALSMDRKNQNVLFYFKKQQMKLKGCSNGKSFGIVAICLLRSNKCANSELLWTFQGAWGKLWPENMDNLGALKGDFRVFFWFISSQN